MFGSWIDWNLDIWRKLDGQYCAKEDKQRWRLDRLGRKLHQIHNSDSFFAALTSNIIMFIMRKSASLLTFEKGAVHNEGLFLPANQHHVFGFGLRLSVSVFYRCHKVVDKSHLCLSQSQTFCTIANEVYKVYRIRMFRRWCRQGLEILRPFV